MNTASKVRMHMGCGEPLQSRWWVAKTPIAQVWLQPTNKKVSERARSPALRREDKCRT